MLVIVLAKVVRERRESRRAAMIAEVRPAVLATLDSGAETTIGHFRGHRRAVAESIAIGLLPKLRGKDRDALAAILQAGGILDQAVLGIGSRSAPRRQRSAELLGTAGYEPAVPGLANLLEDRDADVRLAAAQALGRIGDPGSVSALFSALEARRISANTASMAVLRIGNQGSAGIDRALNSSDPLTRSIATELAGTLGLFTLAIHIVRLLDDVNPMVVTSAVHALGRLSIPEVSPLLILLLELRIADPRCDHSDELTVALAEALGRIGDRRAIPVLEDSLMRRHRLSIAASTSLAVMGKRRSQSSVAARKRVESEARVRA